MNFRQPRIENESHRRFIAGLPCLCCGATDVQCAHIKYSEPEIAKRSVGMQEKSDDCFTVPLCVEHHRLQHAWGNEREWWRLFGIDPVKVALRLYSVSGDQARGEMIVSACRAQLAA